MRPGGASGVSIRSPADLPEQQWNFGLQLDSRDIVRRLAASGRLELVRLVGGEAVSSGDRVPEAGERLLAGGRLALWDVGGPQAGVGSAVAAAAAGDLALRPLGEIGVHLG